MLKVGCHVEANWKTNKVDWYKARVEKVNPDGTYFLKYDDGDKDKKVPRSKIRVRE